VEITPFVFEFAGSEVFFTVGTIENTSAFPQQNVTVEVAFYNFLDEHLGTIRGRLLADVANPGSTYPFIAADVVAGEEAALKDWTRFEALAYSYPIAQASYQEFSFENSTAAQIDGALILEGQLTNTGTQTIDPGLIRIGVSAFDSAGALVGAGDGSLYLEDLLSPNQSAAFEVTIQVTNAPPTSFEFFAEKVDSEKSH
jgi:hypothetical protein